ncbi:MAG: CapA family protein [Polyangiaceae bacterium]|nr:CapA family protein [Polyangiaceae bacterium]
MRFTGWRIWTVGVALVLGCSSGSSATDETSETLSSSALSTHGQRGETSAAVVPTASSTAESNLAPPAASSASVIFGGDVCMGRSIGQEILKNPDFNPFESVAELLATADVRFVNLESQLSDQKGETQSPTQKLVFTGPPGGARALQLGKVGVVSLANNHMWDYGQRAFLETLENLERAGVKYAGAGRNREQAYSPAWVEVNGFKLGILAFTDIWNQGALKVHAAKDYVAEAGKEAVSSAVKAAKTAGNGAPVVVSYHGGEEYVSVPLQRAIDLHHAAIDAGADAVIGHHPHLSQGIEVYKGKPIFYSIGNFLMRTHREHLATEIGFLARIVFSNTENPKTWVCPFRIAGIIPKAIPLKGDGQAKLYERVYEQRFRQVQGGIVGRARILAFEQDGCARVE